MLLEIRYQLLIMTGALLTLGMLAGCGDGSNSGSGGSTSTGGAGGTGGTGGCGGSCGEPVACDPLAGTPSENDICATLGELCDIACSPCQMKCGQDGKWHEECFGCPDSAPKEGDPCDPCVATAECNYQVETTCGFQPAIATCDAAASKWKLAVEACP
jgi:hypothetical protein